MNTLSQRHPYLSAALLCGLTALVAFPLHTLLDLANIVMLFLLAVFVVALYLGRGPALFAACAGVALFDFFFVPPQFSLAVSDAQYLVTFGVMLAVGIITARLVSLVREQTDAATARERETRELYDLARNLAGTSDIGAVANLVARFLVESRGLRAMLLLPDEKGDLCRQFPHGRNATEMERSLAKMAFSQRQLVEADALANTGIMIAFFPLETPAAVRGVLAVAPSDGDEDSVRAQQPLLGALASLTGIAVERLGYGEETQRLQLETAAERMKASVLSALSHDLRTPLTALVGMADGLALYREPLPEAARETAAALRDQARAMSDLLANLLDMARLQAGRVTLRREWQPIEEVIGPASRLLAARLADHPLRVQLASDLPLVAFDAVLMERVFCNLIDNAAKYSPAGGAIDIDARTDGTFLAVAVADHGPGFPSGQEGHVFEMFVRGDNETAQPGVGLGLAICRAIVEAHGGTIVARNRPGGGAEIRFMLPLGNPPTVEEEAVP